MYDFLLALNDTDLSSNNRARIERARDRAAQRKAYALPEGTPLKQASAGFFSLDRVFDTVPVFLFGQNVPAVAYTRLTITRAAPAGDQPGFVPGDIVFQGRISETMLTRFIMEPNRGEAGACVTAEQLGQTRVPAYTKSENSVSAAFQATKDRITARIVQSLADMDLSIDAISNEAGKKAAHQIANAVLSGVSGQQEIDHYLGLYAEGLTKEWVSFASEIAHAALHAEKLAQGKGLPLLAGPVFDLDDARDVNPVVAAALRSPIGEERAALLRAIATIIAPLLVEPEAFVQNGTVVAVPPEKSTHFVSEDGLKIYEKLSGLLRDTYYTHKMENIHEFAMGLTWSHGWTTSLHCSLPPTSDREAQIALYCATEELGRTVPEIRNSYDPLVEMRVSPEDLMMALRGHPEGKMTPCSFRSLAGVFMNSHTLARPEVHSETVSKKVRADLKAHPKSIAATEALGALRDHLATKGLSKAWKETAKTLAQAADAAVRDYIGVLMDTGFDAGRMDITQDFRSKIEEDMRDLLGYLPPQTAMALLPK